MEELLGQALELRPLLGRHRRHHGRHGRHAPGHHLQQLGQRPGVLGEEIAEALHEAVEVVLEALVQHLVALGRIGDIGRKLLVGLLALLQQAVQLGHHVLGPGQVLGGEVVHAVGHLVDVVLHELLAKLLHQVVKPLLGLRRGELIVLQLLDLAGQIRRQHVELELALSHGFVGDGRPALVAGFGRGAGQVVQCLALHVDHIAQLLGDVVVDPAEVVLLQPLLAPTAELLHHLPQALDPLAVHVEPLLEEPPQGRVHVAVVEQVVVHLGEQVGGGELEPGLGSVPAGVGHPMSRPAAAPSPSPKHPANLL